MRYFEGTLIFRILIDEKNILVKVNISDSKTFFFNIQTFLSLKCLYYSNRCSKVLLIFTYFSILIIFFRIIRKH